MASVYISELTGLAAQNRGVQAVVVLLPEDDPKLCQENLRLAELNRKVDDLPDRSVVHVKIERLAPPPPSRLVNPTVELIR